MSPMTNAPGSYTNVFEYVDFIKNTIASGDCETVDPDANGKMQRHAKAAHATKDTAQDKDGLENVQDVAKEVVDKNYTKIEYGNQEIYVNGTNNTLPVSGDTYGE